MTRSMDETAPEGWYTDPHGRHEPRWMSAGTPTRVVRDGEVESSDEPDEAPSVTPMRIVTEVGADAPDLRRADENQMQDDCDPKKAARAPWDVAIDQQAGQLRQIEGTGEVLSLWRSESAGSNPISPTPLCPPEPMAQEGNVSPRPDQGTHLLALNGRAHDESVKDPGRPAVT